MKQTELATAAGHRLEVTHLPVGQLRPNPWNPNRVDPETMHKLREYIRREGLVQPLVVRKMPDHYQILGGFHRWTICIELGYAEVPCVVVDVDDKRAKLLTVNLNELSGEPVPHLRAFPQNHSRASTAPAPGNTSSVKRGSSRRRPLLGVTPSCLKLASDPGKATRCRAADGSRRRRAARGGW